MKKLTMARIIEVNPHWIVYRNEQQGTSYLDLSACANSYARRAPQEENESCRCVGERMERNGTVSYELFDIGHTEISCPMKPSAFQALLGKLTGKEPDDGYSLERQLNHFGWKTIGK